jgi:4-hydroxy-tetrahydrodipicolinate synthase
MLPARPDWSLLVGPEELLAESILLGAHGGVCGGANIFPALYVAAYDAAAQGDLKRARELHRAILQVSERLYHIGRHASAVIKGIKCAVASLGLCTDFMAEPFHRFRDPQRQQIHAAMAELEPLVRRILTG